MHRKWISWKKLAKLEATQEVCARAEVLHLELLECEDAVG